MKSKHQIINVEGIQGITLSVYFKGASMEIKSAQSFNAIPAISIRGVFNLYLSNLQCKLYCKYFISFIEHCKFSTLWQIFTYLLTNMILLDKSLLKPCPLILNKHRYGDLEGSLKKHWRHCKI